MFHFSQKITLHFLLTDLLLTDSNFIIYPLAQNPLAENCQHISGSRQIDVILHPKKLVSLFA